MSATRPDIPSIDETCTAANVHERAEKIAVPVYDWISMPVIAIVDGLIRVDPDDEPPAAVPTPAQKLAASRPSAYRTRGAASPVNADPKR
ncbi:hypothetical protein [Actinoplanes subtropicus]|uniref:hypothetical protein n=1 Tax=Actinoplanes subtropicus TaxID=543632 RepID=UPI0004C452E8|nr:hypothetical protein [Actinoplanes subtropicus]